MWRQGIGFEQNRSERMEDLIKRLGELSESTGGLSSQDKSILGKASNIVDRIGDDKSASVAAYLRQLVSGKKVRAK